MNKIYTMVFFCRMSQQLSWNTTSLHCLYPCKRFTKISNIIINMEIELMLYVIEEKKWKKLFVEAAYKQSDIVKRA